jgi:hypothetical protein
MLMTTDRAMIGNGKLPIAAIATGAKVANRFGSPSIRRGDAAAFAMPRIQYCTKLSVVAQIGVVGLIDQQRATLGVDQMVKSGG